MVGCSAKKENRNTHTRPHIGRKTHTEWPKTNEKKTIKMNCSWKCVTVKSTLAASGPPAMFITAYSRKIAKIVHHFIEPFYIHRLSPIAIEFDVIKSKLYIYIFLYDLKIICKGNLFAIRVFPINLLLFDNRLRPKDVSLHWKAIFE